MSFSLKLMTGAFAVAACGLVAGADAAEVASPVPPISQLTLTQPQYGVEAPASRPLLMSALDQTGLGEALDSARINIYGHIEGSYTWNFDAPAKNLNIGRVFDIKHNDAEVNQVDFNIERTVDLTSHQFDIGGRLELMYGTDARFIHSSDFFSGADFFHGPEYQFDIPQVYLDFGVPVGDGLRIRVGKFLFFKQIDPNASVFYSHSFTFGAALPFTLTGVSALYNITDQLNIEAGVSRGWGQTLTDNNGSIDGFGRIRFTPSDKTNITLAFISGPEDTGDNSHYRDAVDLTLTQGIGDNLTFLLDSVYGNDAAGSLTGTNANWYGVSGYLVLKLDEYLSLAGRGEWYRDEEAFTTGIAQNLYEATVGVTVTPFPSDAAAAMFKIRPEVRYDYSSRGYFDGLTKHDQLTAAVDAIFNF
jgi:hypothetical protein